jgi:hypothetical protein
MPKKYHGQGRGNAVEGLKKAIDEAWEAAKNDGVPQDKKLRVDEWKVSGQNPINWTGIVLVDDDGA